MTDVFIHKAKKLFPAWVITRFSGDWDNQGFKKYLSNTSWALAARIVPFVTSLITVAFIARALGPSNQGKLDYAQSFIAILTTFAVLGIDQILYRDLAAYPERENELLGTAVFTKTVLGIAIFIVAIILSFALKNETLVTGLIAVTGLPLLIYPVNTISVLFNAQVKAKYSSQISIFLSIFLPLLKIGIILMGGGILYLAFALSVEAIITTSWSLYVYVFILDRSPRNWYFSKHRLLQILSDSWPLFLASLSGYVYGRIDQIMIMHYRETASVGLYSAAVRITELLTLVPAVLASALFPAIINAQKTSHESYIKRFKLLLEASVLITLVGVIPIYIFAPLVIKIIYGSAFAGAAMILRLYVWTGLGTVLVVLVQQFLIAENKSKIFLIGNLAGATLNAGLNVFLIPRYGATGATISTAIAYLTVIISVFIFNSTRPLMLQISGLQKVMTHR